METQIRKIGNSAGVILPKYLIDKYSLNKVTIIDSDGCILIKPSSHESIFQQLLTEAKLNKARNYELVKKEAESIEAVEYYNNPENIVPDVDDFIEY